MSSQGSPIEARVNQKSRSGVVRNRRLRFQWIPGLLHHPLFPSQIIIVKLSSNLNSQLSELSNKNNRLPNYDVP